MVVVLFHTRQDWFLAGGFLGVDVFFVLSGFLITAILQGEWARNGTIRLGRFYGRRFIRLMPPLLFVLLVYTAFASWFWPAYPQAAHQRDALLAGLYLSDYTVSFWGLPKYLNHSWSLAVEEHFYLLWPLVLPLILRCKNPARVTLLLYAVAAIWRLGNFIWLDWGNVYYRFDTRVAGILIGAWLAIRDVQEGKDAWPRVPPWLLWFAIILLGLVFGLMQWNHLEARILASPLVELISLVLIVAVVQQGNAPESWPLRLAASPPVVWIGKLSYGIYLWHFPIALITRNTLPYFQALTLTLVASIALSWLSWHTVERAARHLRRWFDQRGALVHSP